MDVSDRLSQEELKALAAKGQLTWKGKKVALDPFQTLGVIYEVDREGDHFLVHPKVEKEMELFSLGGLQHGIFRFWKEDKPEPAQKLTYLELQEFLQDHSVIWKCPVYKPEPLPILVLQDRTGAFAHLEMDFGLLGRKEMGSSPEELFWEKDLLSTDFVKKGGYYYCPMDKVVKSLTFLLDVGWTILDHRGKKLVRQGASELTAATERDCIVVRGKISYGDHKADLQGVVGAFNRREKFIDLTPTEVGLVDFPKEWEPLAEEGVAVKRHHIGLLEDVVPLPPEYRRAEWKETPPTEKFQGKLFAYQQQGVDWLSFLYRSGFSGLLADEMGLGKTVQVIAFLSTIECEKPILIVTPVSLLFHWKKELERFLPGVNVVLTSYSKLKRMEAEEFGAVILDEAQAIKNPETLTAQIVCRLRAPFKLAITGTPIENRYDDLWSIFRFLMPGLLEKNPVIERVKKKIRPFTLRRTKAEVDLQLPEKQEQIVWTSFDEEQKSFYDQFLKERRSMVKQKIEILELILRLRQICCHPRLVSGEYTGRSSKFETVCTDLEEVISSGHKVILYSQFTSVLHLFKAWATVPYAYLDGQTLDREKEVEKFQNDPEVRLFLMSLKAGGVGLNLQAADYVFLYDPWWNEAAEKQAIDRAHRLGRTKPVIARKYLMAESIEEKILKLQGHKRALSENLLEFEGDVYPVSLDELYALIS